MNAYLKEVRSEMQRVTWPNKKDLRRMSLTSIGILTAAGITLWLTDTAIVAVLALISKF